MKTLTNALLALPAIAVSLPFYLLGLVAGCTVGAFTFAYRKYRGSWVDVDQAVSR